MRWPHMLMLLQGAILCPTGSNAFLTTSAVARMSTTHHCYPLWRHVSLNEAGTEEASIASEDSGDVSLSLRQLMGARRTDDDVTISQQPQLVRGRTRNDVMKQAMIGMVAVAANVIGASTQEAHARTEPLGVIQGLLADCVNDKSCAHSQDDRPACWQEPWQYDSSLEKTMAKLKRYIASLPGSEFVSEDERYVRVEFHNGKDVDDTEFYFTPNDAIIQFRSARRGSNNDGGANLKRMEKIRIALGLEKVSPLSLSGRCDHYFYRFISLYLSAALDTYRTCNRSQC